MDDTTHIYLAQAWEFRCAPDSGGAGGWRWCCRSQDGVVIANGTAAFPSLSAAIEDAQRNGFRYYHGAS